MPEYDVKYEITVDADSPIEAAVEVKRILLDSDSVPNMLPVLDVVERDAENAETFRVDFEQNTVKNLGELWRNESHT